MFRSCRVLCSVTMRGAVAIDDCNLKRSASFEKLSWTFSIDYDVTIGTLLYFTKRRGFRSGGLNQRATTLAQRMPFQPESVMAYELGVKSDLTVRNQFFLVNAARVSR
jgi:outer membrane receptor protein involved in Fe transport